MTARKRLWVLESLESRTLLSISVGSVLGNVSVSPGAAPTAIDLSGAFDDPTTVLVSTSNGDIPIQMLSSAAPNTVSNFLRYVNAGLYNGTVFHSAVPSFIDEAGGFKTDGSAIPSFGTIPNEFQVSNTIGTVAMGKVSGNPDSAASEWFINVGNNAGVLDTQNGGFTVFGQVVDNGMTVANAINALPTVDGSLFNSTLPAKPNDPLPVQNAANGIAVSNLVVINSVSVEHSLTLSALSDDPSVATASIGSDGHTLMLSYPTDAKGVAHITVTGHDADGDSVNQRFRVNVGTTGDLITVTVGKSAAKQMIFTQDNGAVVAVSLRGPGTADIAVLGNSPQASAGKHVVITGSALSLFGIVTHGTTAATTLSITTHGKGAVSLGGITTDSALGALTATTLTLTGNLTAGGPVRSVALGGINNSNELTGNAQISAPSIGTFTVAKTLTDATIDLSGSGMDLRSFVAGGLLTDVAFNSSGSINSFSAGGTSGTTVFAGVGPLPSGQVLPDASTQFSAATAIKTFKVKGLFSSTNVAAQALGNLSLGSVKTANGAVPFGVAGHTITSLTGVNSTNHKKIVAHHLTSAAVAAALEATLALADFKLNLL